MAKFCDAFFKILKKFKNDSKINTNVPKISIIIPCYNAEKYINNVDKMLKAQIYDNFEVIFINDGSTDNTEQALRNLEDSRYSLINIGTNIGAGAARNIGLSQAKGEYVIFLDIDDFYFPNMLKLCYNKAIETNSDIIMFKTVCFDEKTNNFTDNDIDWLWTPPFPLNKKFNQRKVRKNLFTFCRGALWNKFYKRSLLAKNKLYFLNLKRHNDSFFAYTSYVCAKTFYIINEVLYAYRINSKTAITATRDGDIECKNENIKALRNFLIKNNSLKYYEKALKKYENTF